MHWIKTHLDFISAGSDYEMVDNVVLAFTTGSSNGDTIEAIVNITDDNAYEKDEYFNVTIFSSEANVIIHNSEETVRIISDDSEIFSMILQNCLIFSDTSADSTLML